MFQPTPKSTLNVSNLSFHPATHALLASAIGRPIAELAEERSSAAPSFLLPGWQRAGNGQPELQQH